MVYSSWRGRRLTVQAVCDLHRWPGPHHSCPESDASLLSGRGLRHHDESNRRVNLASRVLDSGFLSIAIAEQVPI